MFTPIRGASALAGAFVLVAAATAAPPVPVGDLHVQPASLTLTHARRPHSLLVTARSTDGLSLDLTGQATYRSSNDKVATVSVSGLPPGVAVPTVTVKAGQADFQLVLRFPPAFKTLEINNLEVFATGRYAPTSPLPNRSKGAALRVKLLPAVPPKK